MKEKSCFKCIHYNCCMNWQHTQDRILDRNLTTEDDFAKSINSEHCPFYLDDEIVTHQQAEIERLQKEVNLVSMQFQDLQERYEEAQAEIERLKDEYEESKSDNSATLSGGFLNI